jgi:protein involved in polysaccharide export with SLBB domain
MNMKFCKSGRIAVILAVLAIYGWLSSFAQAHDPPSTNTQSHALSETNARPPQTAAATGNPGPSTNAATTDAINSMDALDDRHRLNIGDRLSFRIVEDEEDPKVISVTVSGDMEVPYIGRFAVAGQTCKEIARKLKAELEKKYYFHATVILAVNEWARSQGKVYVVGAVHVPGPQEIPSDEVLNVSKAVLRAGGFGDYADKHKVEVRRKSAVPGGKDQVFTVDVAEILEKNRKTDSDLPLKADDMIYVPERFVRF